MDISFFFPVFPLRLLCNAKHPTIIVGQVEFLADCQDLMTVSFLFFVASDRRIWNGGISNFWLRPFLALFLRIIISPFAVGIAHWHF